MNCKAFQVEIEELDDTKPLSHKVSVHLESCADCVRFRENHLSLKGMIGSLEVVTAPADFDFRLRARLATLKNERLSPMSWIRYAPSARSLAIAAAVVIVALVSLAVRQAILVPNVDTGRERIVTSNPVDKVAPSIPPVAPSVGNDPYQRIASSQVGPAETRASNSKSNARKLVYPNVEGPIEGSARKEDITSMDLASTSTANTVLPPGIPDPMTLNPSMVGLPVRASIRPTKIALVDDGSGPRAITLRPVIFGGQDMFDTESKNRRIVSVVQGQW